MIYFYGILAYDLAPKSRLSLVLHLLFLFHPNQSKIALKFHCQDWTNKSTKEVLINAIFSSKSNPKNRDLSADICAFCCTNSRWIGHCQDKGLRDGISPPLFWYLIAQPALCTSERFCYSAACKARLSVQCMGRMSFGWFEDSISLGYLKSNLHNEQQSSIQQTDNEV